MMILHRDGTGASYKQGKHFNPCTHRQKFSMEILELKNIVTRMKIFTKKGLNNRFVVKEEIMNKFEDKLIEIVQLKDQ